MPVSCRLAQSFIPADSATSCHAREMQTTSQAHPPRPGRESRALPSATHPYSRTSITGSGVLTTLSAATRALVLWPRPRRSAERVDGDVVTVHSTDQGGNYAGLGPHG
jgi:hypothetical protein